MQAYSVVSVVWLNTAQSGKHTLQALPTQHLHQTFIRRKCLCEMQPHKP